MSIRPKVLMIGSVPPPYHGSSIYFSNLLNSRIKNEFEIKHLDISDHRDLSNLSKLDFTNVKLAIGSILRLRKMIIAEKPDLIYIPVASNFLPYLRDGLFILTASARSNSKIIIHLHEGKYFREGFYEHSNVLVRNFIKHSLSKVDKAIVLGKSLTSVFDGLVDSVDVCQNGVADEYKEPDVKSSNEGKVVIGFLGNLFESKGVLDILKAAVIVLSENQNAEFHFAGDWKDRSGGTYEKAMKIIRENKIESKIKFHGILTGDEKRQFLHDTDILLFPTWYRHEGFPLVIIEAMSAGIPVVSSANVGAISDIILNNETGLLIEKKNINEIIGALNKLLNNSELRKQMGMKGRKRYEEFYTIEKNVNRMIDIFNDTLS